MLKKIISSIILAASITMLFPLTAAADVIFEPRDSFYERNYDSMEYLNRRFYANGVNGFISLKSEPGSNTEVTAFENGTIVFISHTYNHRGSDWGVITFDYGASRNGTGWVPMDQLELVYDNDEFTKDFGNDFYNFDGDISALLEVEELIFWTWPGSGEIAMTDSNMQDRSQDPALSWLQAHRAYRDADGREWLIIPYYYASRATWVCLSDPGNRDIPAFNQPQSPQLRPPVDPSTVQTGGIPTPIIAAILVAVLAVGTIVLIKLLWKPKKNV